MSELKNIWEDILSSFLERSLSLRFDICTCPKCKKKMMELLLVKFPPVYVEKNSLDYQRIQKGLVRKHSKEIFQEVSKAIDYVSRHLPHSVEVDREKEFEILLAKIKEERGIDFSSYHRSLLKRRIALRLLANKVKSYMEYLKILASNPSEYEKLFDVLTINVSEFFRDPVVWRGIEAILIKIIEDHNKREEPIIFWSAGCAKGEEPYSLSILVHRINKLKVPLKIYATDIDEETLKEAERGQYNPDELKNVEEDILSTYFTFKDGKYCINEEIKRVVEFRYLDLTSDEFIPHTDLILCRNVFIYFTKALQEKVLDKFYRSLKEGGYLVIGKSETLIFEARTIFEEVDGDKRIYRKKITDFNS